MSPVRSGPSCKECSAAEGVFSLTRSIWGSWEEARGNRWFECGGRSGAAPEARLLTGASHLPGCPPCCAIGVPSAAQPSRPAKGHGNVSVRPATPSATDGCRAECLCVLPSPPAHRASLPASVSPPPPRSGADAADPFERRFELRCRGAPCAPPMLFRVTSRLTLEWITPSLRPTRADGGAARRGGSAAARWQSRPAQRASAAALGALVWGRWRAAGGVRRCGWSVRVLGRRGDNPRRRGRREHGCAGAGAEGELGAASLPAGAAPGWGGGEHGSWGPSAHRVPLADPHKSPAV